MGIREEIKSYIVRSGMTMTEVVDRLYDDYDWSRSVPNLSGKLRRGSLRYQEAVELADVLEDVYKRQVLGNLSSFEKLVLIFPLALKNVSKIVTAERSSSER